MKRAEWIRHNKEEKFMEIPTSPAAVVHRSCPFLSGRERGASEVKCRFRLSRSSAPYNVRTP